MTEYIAGRYDEFIGKLIKALGLPSHTKGFEIRCYFDEAVTVRCEYWPEKLSKENVETITERFKLVKIDDFGLD